MAVAGDGVGDDPGSAPGEEAGPGSGLPTGAGDGDVLAAGLGLWGVTDPGVDGRGGEAPGAAGVGVPDWQAITVTREMAISPGSADLRRRAAVLPPGSHLPIVSERFAIDDALHDPAT